jgi:tRNA-splicing ligase RtcB
MQKVISTERLPIKIWLDEPEEGSMIQARNLTNLPFAFKQVCLMPDTHQGYGMPIGGVLATQGVIIPNAVEWILVVVCAPSKPISRRKRFPKNYLNKS